jgi:hypothetical protein
MTSVLSKIYGKNSIEIHKQLTRDDIDIMVSWSYGGWHMINILPNKPNAEIFGDVTVKSEIQKLVDDWIETVDYRVSRGQEVVVRQKLDNVIEAHVLEKVIASNKSITKMFFFKELDGILCATKHGVLFSFPLNSTTWSNCNAYFAFDLDDGLITLGEGFNAVSVDCQTVTSHLEKWKKSNYEGDLFPKYIPISETK